MNNFLHRRHSLGQHNLDDSLTPLKQSVRKVLKERNGRLQDDFEEVLSPADKVLLHLAGGVPLDQILEHPATPVRALNPSSHWKSKQNYGNGVNPAVTLLNSVINDPDIHNTSLNAIEEFQNSSKNASVSSQHKRRVTSFNINTDENSKRKVAMASDTNEKNIFTVLKEKRFESASAARRLQAFEALKKAHEDELAADEPVELPYEELLKGLNVFAEVRDGEDNRSYGIKAKLRQMGATVHNTLNKKVTHVIFRDGHLSTYKRAKEIGAHLVSVLWLEATQNAKRRVPESNYPALGLEQYSSPITSKRFRRIKSMQPDYEGTREKNYLRNLKRMATIEAKKLLKNSPVKTAPAKKTNARATDIAKGGFLEALKKHSENNPSSSKVPSEVTSSDEEFYMPPLVERLRENYIRIMSPTADTKENGIKKNEVIPKLKKSRKRNIVVRETMSPIKTQDCVPFSQDLVAYSILDMSQRKQNVEKTNQTLEANRSQTSITQFFQPSQNKEPENQTHDSDTTDFSFNENDLNSAVEKSPENCKLNEDSLKDVFSDDHPGQGKSNKCLNTVSKSDSSKEDSIHLRISTDDSSSYSKNRNIEDSLNIDALVKALNNDTSGTLRAKLLEKLGIENVNKTIETNDSALDKCNSSNEIIEISNDGPESTEKVGHFNKINKTTNEITYDSDFSYKIISDKDNEAINNNSSNEIVKISSVDPKNVEKINVVDENMQDSDFSYKIISDKDNEEAINNNSNNEIIKIPSENPKNAKKIDMVDGIMQDSDFSVKDNQKAINDSNKLFQDKETIEQRTSSNKIKNKAGSQRKTLGCVKAYGFDTSKRVTRLSIAQGLQVPIETKKIEDCVGDLDNEPVKSKRIERRVTRQSIAKDWQTPSKNQNDTRKILNSVESIKKRNTPSTNEAVSIMTETPHSSAVLRSRRKTTFINGRINGLELESDVTKNEVIDADGIDTNKERCRKTVFKLGSDVDLDNVDSEKSSKIRKSLFMTDDSNLTLDEVKTKLPESDKIIDLDKNARRKTVFQLGSDKDSDNVNSEKSSKTRKSLFVADSSKAPLDEVKTKSPEKNVINLDKKARRKTVFQLGSDKDSDNLNSEKSSKTRKSLFVADSSKAPLDEVKTKSPEKNVINLDMKARRKTVFQLGSDKDSDNLNSEKSSKIRKSLFVADSSKAPLDEVKTKSPEKNVINLDKKARRKTVFQLGSDKDSDNVNSNKSLFVADSSKAPLDEVKTKSPENDKVINLDKKTRRKTVFKVGPPKINSDNVEKASKNGKLLFVTDSKASSLDEIKTKPTESEDDHLEFKTHRKVVFKFDCKGVKKVVKNDASIDLTEDSDADNVDEQLFNKKADDNEKTEREFNLEKNENADKTPESKNSNNVGLTTTGKKRKLFSFNNYFSEIEADLDSVVVEPVLCPYSPVKRKVKQTKCTKKSKTNSSDEKTSKSCDKSKTSSSDEIPENEQLKQNVLENGVVKRDPSYHSDRRSTLLFLPKQSRESLEKLKKEEAVNRTHKKSEKLPSIVCTRMHSGDVVLFEGVVKKLGGFVVENTVSSRTTHVVCGDMQRSLNLLRALARGCWVLKQEWLLKSLELQHWIDEEAYEMVEFSPAVKKCRVERLSFGQPYTVNLLNDCGPIFISRNSKPSWPEMEELVKLCGGTITNTARSASIVIGEVTRYRDAVCVSEKWILDSITKKKKVQFKKYNLER